MLAFELGNAVVDTLALHRQEVVVDESVPSRKLYQAVTQIIEDRAATNPEEVSVFYRFMGGDPETSHLKRVIRSAVRDNPQRATELESALSLTVEGRRAGAMAAPQLQSQPASTGGRMPIAAPVRPVAAVRPKPPVRVGDAISRVIFGGFWLVISIVIFSYGITHSFPAVLFSFAAFAYSIYIFRGGRFRFLFW